jgi:hypothetical protein
VANRSSAQAFAWLLILTGLFVAADLSREDPNTYNLLNLVGSCTVTVAQYFVTRGSVSPNHAEFGRGGSFARFFLFSIAGGLAILLGLVLLVLPGIFLAVRWAAAAPALISEDLPLGEAFGRSWRGTKTHFWSILLLFAAIWVPTLLLAAVATWLEPGPVWLGASLIFNLPVNASIIVGWLAAVAVYEIVVRPPGIETVFA